MLGGHPVSSAAQPQRAAAMTLRRVPQTEAAQTTTAADGAPPRRSGPATERRRASNRATAQNHHQRSKRKRSPPQRLVPHRSLPPMRPWGRASRPPRRQNSPAKIKKTHSQPQGGQPRPRMAADTAEGPPAASAPGARPSSTRRWQAEDQTSQRARPAQTPTPGREGREPWREKGRGAAARCTTSSSPNPYYGTRQLEGAERNWDVSKGKGEDDCGASVAGAGAVIIGQLRSEGLNLQRPATDQVCTQSGRSFSWPSSSTARGRGCFLSSSLLRV